MDYERYVNLPLDSYILAEGEELRRPEVIRRLSFDYLFPRAYWFEAAPFARHIVPIELVEPGDVQVVVYKKAGELRPEPLDIDFLADFPTIISVVANRLVTARRPLPHIRELFVVNNATTVDQETLSNLPGLVSLSLGSGFVSRELELEEIETYDWEADKLDLNVLRCMPDLRDLRLHALAAHSIEPLGYLDTLERLRIEGFHRGRSASHLGSLRKLRWLALEDRTGLMSA